MLEKCQTQHLEVQDSQRCAVGAYRQFVYAVVALIKARKYTQERCRLAISEQTSDSLPDQEKCVGTDAPN